MPPIQEGRHCQPSVSKSPGDRGQGERRRIRARMPVVINDDVY